MPSKFRKGQLLICTHYRDRPLVKVTSIRGHEVWVIEARRFDNSSWWGPRSWFKAKATKKRKVAKKVNKIMAEHERNRARLCDAGVPGCTCNQVASIGG